MDAAATPHESNELPFGPRRKWSPRRYIALAAIAGLGVLGWQLTMGSGGDGSATTFSTQPVARGDVVSRVTATGTLSPVVQVEVGSQVSGRIKELHADYNSEVTAGQIVAVIDSQLFESAVAQARARLQSSHADLRRARAVAANARAQYQRTEKLAADGVVSSAEVDVDLADMRSADAQVSAALAAITLNKAALEQAETNLAYTTIRSPIDGMVVSRNVDVGQTVAASLSAPTLFVIAEDLRKMEVLTSVAESDVGQVRPGGRVEFTVDAFPDKTFTGEVKQVRYEAETVSNVVTYDAVVGVSNDRLELRPGMTANVTFVVDERPDVLAVPNKALRYRPADAEARLAGLRRPGREGRPAGQAERAGKPAERQPGAESSDAGRRRVVWVLRDGQPAPVSVRTGLSDGSVTEVSGELDEGDAIILADDSRAGQTGDAKGQQTGGRRGPPRVL